MLWIFLMGVISGPLAAQPATGRDTVTPWNPPWAASPDAKGQSWVQPLFPNSHEAVFFPDWYPDADSGESIGLPTSVPQAVMARPEPRPRRAGRSQTHEYEWPESVKNDSPTLAIVLKDGTVKLALSMCVQDEKLTYVTVGGKGDQVSLSSVDLGATRRANAPIGPRESERKAQ